MHVVRVWCIVLVAFVLAPSAAAWTTLGTGVQDTVVPSMIVTQADTELVSFDSPVAGTISVSRNRAAPKVVVTARPGTIYQVSAAALPGEPGSLDVILNTGATLIEQQLRPGLTVHVTKTKKGKVVTRWAQALDDGFPVPTATFRIGGRTLHADARGKGASRAAQGRLRCPAMPARP